jgi:hypothetical protein
MKRAVGVFPTARSFIWMSQPGNQALSREPVRQAAGLAA